MNDMTFEQFKEYTKLKYVNLVGPKEDNTDNLNDYVLSFADSWFYITDSVFYILLMIGFGVQYLNGSYSFYSVNPEITPHIQCGDQLVLINDCLPSKTNVLKEQNNELILTTMTPTGAIQEVLVKLPIIEFSNSQNTQYIDMEDGEGLIRISSFSLVDNELLRDFLKNKKIAHIDLRNCTGGQINEMLAVVTVFIKDKVELPVYTQSNEKRIKVIHPPIDSLQNLKEVNLIVGNMTASSAEIFCVLLRTMFDGKIYGEKTVGKFIIQELIKVDDHIVSLPVYRVEKPNYFYGDKVAYYDKNKIVPDERQVLKRVEKYVSMPMDASNNGL